METQSYGVGKLSYCNPKYFSHCSVVTTPRVVAGVERLFTNYSFTTIVYIANNFTAAGIFTSYKGIRFKVEHKLCDYFRQFWVQAMLQKSIGRMPCPAPPGTFSYYDIEIPPPNVPVPMRPGTYHLYSEVYTTITKERALVIDHTIHFAEDYQKNRKKMNKKKKG
ncbi:uncharacterized protein LOC114366166 [Ostrinia furnacalis]|uniref:uncharacterized protein LOC114366166 n=1 Tax=Ostrinia furnacalis TaxID=93504 RepID=UPI0010402E66|nr:uncharacterized protein LOC114366166 [Ostrinia furnacalis]